jgi:hypothetical protein
LARATGLEPATSGVTGREMARAINANGYFWLPESARSAAKVSGGSDLLYGST